jgi:hypothetical protein
MLHTIKPELSELDALEPVGDDDGAARHESVDGSLSLQRKGADLL